MNFENVEKVEKIAYECDALQLARYCEMFEIKKDNEIKKDGENDVKGEYEEMIKIFFHRGCTR